MKGLLEHMESHMASCMYKKYIGIECPWCGLQRSFYFLLKGDFQESFTTFPPLLPLMIMVLFLIAHLIFKFKKGHKILMGMFITNIIILVLSYTLKIIIN